MARNDFGWVRCYKVNDGNGGKRNRYQASYLNPRNKGERINAPRRFDHKSDAHAWLAEVRKQIDAGDWRTPEEVLAERQAEDAAQRRRDMPFREFADEWFEKNVDRFRPRTKETYKGLLKRYILPFFGERPLSRITVDLVNKWYGGLADKKTARANSYGLLKQIFKCACEPPEQLMEFNPCRIRGGTNRGVKEERPIAEPEQIKMIADEVDQLTDGDYGLSILLAAWLSLRSGEVRALRVGDFDLDKELLHVSRALTYTKEDGFTEGEPKTKAGIRTVGIPSFLVAEIRAFLRRKKILTKKTALLFPNKSGGYLHAAEIKKPFLIARDKVGCDGLRFHDLRHTGNSYAMQTGLATISDLQRRGGWSTPSMALHYSHSTDRRQQAITKALNDRALGKDDDRTAPDKSVDDSSGLLDVIKSLREQNALLTRLLTEKAS